MRVILSHPYSGALYWWLQSGYPYAHPKRPGHPYYRHLYGNVDAHIDMALACTVVFDEILVPAADFGYPNAESSDDHRKVRVPDIELLADWGPVHAAYDLRDDYIADVLADSDVQQILRRVARGVRPAVVRDVVTDALMMVEHSVPLVSSTGRRSLILRMSDMGALPGINVAATEERVIEADLQRLSEETTSQLASYVSVAGLMFASPDLETLRAVKWNSKIRDYAAAFQRVITGDDTSVQNLYERIAEAWTAKTVAAEASSAFSTTSRALSVLSLVPGVGTVTELVSMSADAGAMAADRRVEKKSWFELGPEIKRVESLELLKAELVGRGLL